MSCDLFVAANMAASQGADEPVPFPIQGFTRPGAAALMANVLIFVVSLAVPLYAAQRRHELRSIDALVGFAYVRLGGRGNTATTVLTLHARSSP